MKLATVSHAARCDRDSLGQTASSEPISSCALLLILHTGQGAAIWWKRGYDLRLSGCTQLDEVLHTGKSRLNEYKTLDSPGGRMASKVSAPNMPMLEMVKVPLLNSSGASFFALARFTRSAQLRLI